MAKAKYYLLTSDFIDGREAERIGLVSKALPAAEVLPAALAIAERLALGPREATLLTKRALNHWLRQALPNFEASLAYEMLNFLGPDAAEGLAALRQKRRAGVPPMTHRPRSRRRPRARSRAGRIADAITLPHYEHRSFNLDWKANRTEVTEADREAESAIAAEVLDAPTRRRAVRRGARPGRQRRLAVALGHRPHRRHLQLRPRHPGVGHADRADPRGSRPSRRRRVGAGAGPPLVGRHGVSAPSPTADACHVSTVARLDEAQVCVTFSKGWDDARSHRPAGGTAATAPTGPAASATSGSTCWSPRGPSIWPSTPSAWRRTTSPR